MTTPDPWDDERLDAAFAARAVRAAEVSPDLATETADALRRQPTRGSAPWWRPLPIAAAAAVVVSVVGLSLAMSWRTGTPPAPTGPSAPVASAAVPSDARPDTVLGLPVIDVPAALAVRDAGEDDRELAVRGWYSPIFPIGPCTAVFVQRYSPVQPDHCPAWWAVLMTEPVTEPESLSAPFDEFGRLLVGDAFEMDLDALDRSGLPVVRSAGPAEPVEIVVIGHFDDRRSRLCRPGFEQACRDRFVVDRIDQIAGEAQALSHVTMHSGQATRSTLAEVEAVHALAAPDATVLSVVTADNESIDAVEPTLEVDLTDLPDGSFYLPIQWVLCTLEGDRPQTYVVTDGTDEVWRMDIDGNLVRVANGPVETPLPTEGPWPPEGTVARFSLTSPVGAGMPPVEVAVIDPTGVIVTAREVSVDDPIIRLSEDAYAGRAWVTGQPEDPRSIRLGWTGGICDQHVTVTVDSLDSILIDGGLQPACDAIGIERELVLTYSEPVDPAVIDVSYNEIQGQAGEIVPPPTSAPPFENGKLAVVGVDGGPGELRCNGTPFPVSGLAAPLGAEDRVGPEFDVLRATLADPGLEYGAGDANALSWREAGRTDDTVVFLAEKPTNGDERYWIELSLRLDPTGWRFDGGGDCQPRALLPDGVGPATWILDPAFAEPTAQDTTIHLLVTETACASRQPADDRLAPAYVVASPYQIDITIGVHTRLGGQTCPGNPPVAVEIDLGTPIGDRPLIDPNAPPPEGSGG